MKSMKTKLELAPFDHAALCEKGRAFADLIFDVFPETKGNASMFKDRDGTWNPSLWLKSPKGEDRDIEFYVDEASGGAFRWTIYYNDHFDDYETVERTFERVELITSDKLVLCVAILGGEWKASLMADPRDRARIDEFVNKYGADVIIYSFNGTNDRQVFTK